MKMNKLIGLSMITLILVGVTMWSAVAGIVTIPTRGLHSGGLLYSHTPVEPEVSTGQAQDIRKTPRTYVAYERYKYSGLSGETKRKASLRANINTRQVAPSYMIKGRMPLRRFAQQSKGVSASV